MSEEKIQVLYVDDSSFERQLVRNALVQADGDFVLVEAATLDAGIQKLNLNTAELSAGLYFVNVNVNGISKTLRVNVAH